MSWEPWNCPLSVRHCTGKMQLIMLSVNSVVSVAAHLTFRFGNYCLSKKILYGFVGVVVEYISLSQRFFFFLVSLCYSLSSFNLTFSYFPCE